jgi:hypothetical protein
VGIATQEVLVRDSNEPEGTILAFKPESWSAFVAAVRRGEFDR